MSYADQNGLGARLAPELLVMLADDDGDGVADTAILTAALDDASAEIDQALSGRYVTPVSPVPNLLIRWCVDLAVAGLFRRKREGLPREHAEEAALTRRTLEAIASGLANLSGAQARLEDFETENTQRGEDATFMDDSLEMF